MINIPWCAKDEIKRLEIKRNAILPLFPINGHEINRLNILISWLTDHLSCTEAEYQHCEAVAWREPDCTRQRLVPKSAPKQIDWDSELPDGMIRDFSGRIRPQPKSILEELLPNREPETSDYEIGPNGEPALVNVLNSISLEPPPYFLNGMSSDNVITKEIKSMDIYSLIAAYSDDGWNTETIATLLVEFIKEKGLEADLRKFLDVQQMNKAPGSICDECGSFIPNTPNGFLENKHHNDSCSLYDPDKE